MPSNKGTTWKLAGAKTTTDIFNYYLSNVTYNNILDKKQFKEILEDLNKEFMRMIIFMNYATKKVCWFGKILCTLVLFILVIKIFLTM